MTKLLLLGGGNQRTRLFILSVALVFASGCAEQRIHDDAMAQARTGNFEGSIRALQVGLDEHPDSNLLRASLIETRTDAITRIVSMALTARSEGHLDAAEQILRRAVPIAPDDPRVRSVLADLATDRRLRAALLESQSLVAQRKSSQALAVLDEALKANPTQADLLAMKRRIESDQRVADLKASRLGLSETRPISLDFRDASLRTVLDTVSRSSGINFILDKDIRFDPKVTVYLRSVKVEDALDLITSTNQLSTKVVDSRTMLIYPNTVEKQREYQEQIVRVFYLSSADVKGASAFLKSMLKMREPYVDERSNMIAIRESHENVQLAERLISLYDVPDPEVLLEMDVIELNTTRLTQLGIQYPDSFGLTVLPPSDQTGLTLGNIRGITRDQIGLTFGSVTVNLSRQTGDFNTLANPRVRVKSREKAHILVGDKIPIVTSTQGSTGFVSESVSYIDVGLKLDVEPTVYVDDDVGIRISLEVSTRGNQLKTAAGTIAYEIGTRNASTLLRLHDGETQLLAGLINTQDNSTSTKVPGLGDLPVAGRLFSSQLDNGQRVELVLSITPHVVRNIHRPEASEAELWVGTEALPRLRPAGGVAAAADALGVSDVQTNAAQSRANFGPGSAPAADVPTLPAEAPAPSLAAHFDGPSQVTVGATFSVNLNLQTVEPLRGAPVQLAYDSARLELLDIVEGDLFKQGGTQTGFTKVIDATNGRASAGVLRTTATGAKGAGSVFVLSFKARAPGPANVTLLSLQPVGLAGPVAPLVAPRALQIQVK